MIHNFINIFGKKFDRLLVIDNAPSNKYGTAMWKCKCDCGKERIVSGVDLRAGKHKSCGCLKSEINKIGKRKKPFWWLYYKMSYVSKKSKKDFNISYDEYLKFTEVTNCHYCNTSIVWKPHFEKDVKCGYNLDRKDNHLGYSKENCVVCCSVCNHVKGNIFTYDEMLILGKTINEIRKI